MNKRSKEYLVYIYVTTRLAVRYGVSNNELLELEKAALELFNSTHNQNADNQTVDGFGERPL